MMSGTIDKVRFAVVDGDYKRRASVVRKLLDIGGHVEPFEQAAELENFCREETIVMVYDEGRSVEDVLNLQRQEGINNPVIGYTDDTDIYRISDAFHLGVSDYIPLPLEPKRLPARLAAALAKTKAKALNYRKSAKARERLKRLSNREVEVLDCLAQGASTKQIATELGLSARTVEVHRAKIYSKLGVSHALEAVKVKTDSETI
ncbi:hypothetical protein GRI69_15625 [Erythrobacter vulgaris]|uniref:Uncharacterized protein n=1 Tax=Qipengyuania vulgaris TaxID=291985 RepID=A0A844XWE1_9SPHN|nr:LuxR C-terminal-related transcriptional regulator [Qipengyuania vulgaris]MXO49679.1 hypothetical protein [Qipengyuania vulgaris]